MSRIVLVGGAGYIGSRLVPRLNEKSEVVVVDPCILGEPEFPRRLELVRERWNNFVYLPDDIVVWLASLHRPLEEDTRKWDDVFDEVMVDGPDFVAGDVKRFVYVSSMQAVTGSDIYAEAKRNAEWMITRKTRDWRIIRPGTVWGGLARPGPKRLHTVPNAWLSRKAEPPEGYACYTAELDQVLDVLEAATLSDCEPRTITNVVDFPEPTTAEQIRELSVPARDWFERADPGPHPMELYSEYYDIR